MAMAGFTALEGSELQRLERCEDELAKQRAAISDIRARLEEFQARRDVLEKARNHVDAYIAGE